jgi:hypothetical protein
MLRTAISMFTLVHDATSGDRRVSYWPQAELAMHTTDAVSGV